MPLRRIWVSATSGPDSDDLIAGNESICLPSKVKIHPHSTGFVLHTVAWENTLLESQMDPNFSSAVSKTQRRSSYSGKSDCDQIYLRRCIVTMEINTALQLRFKCAQSFLLQRLHLHYRVPPHVLALQTGLGRPSDVPSDSGPDQPWDRAEFLSHECGEVLVSNPPLVDHRGAQGLLDECLPRARLGLLEFGESATSRDNPVRFRA
ncbi:hypothetical protein PILCRDRAFT_93246 [Piloderma croceum F 1598]|uniref:Uncharacterized protein n=1 Tax=Piloderma croceum (strain F 1598) TaxID=765440 RepID=A0A0C3B6R0_PILCF|nr:hypothetical protein PILCRDRAFT_93246 [Piloderma croceum F 1598]